MGRERADVDGAIALLRRSWRSNDGAEGDSVRLVCDEVERLRAEQAGFSSAAAAMREVERLRKLGQEFERRLCATIDANIDLVKTLREAEAIANEAMRVGREMIERLVVTIADMREGRDEAFGVVVERVKRNEREIRNLRTTLNVLRGRQ